MESVFYKHVFSNSFPITYLFLEVFGKTVEKFGNEVDRDTVISAVLVKLGHKENPSAEKIAEVLQAMEGFKAYTEAKEKPGAGRRSKDKSFGEDLLEWLGKMQTDEILFVLSDFDFEKAYKLYSETPAEIVDQMIQTKLEMMWKMAKKDFESVLFGMGGKMKRSSANSVHNDKSDKGEAAKVSRLSKLGFT